MGREPQGTSADAGDHAAVGEATRETAGCLARELDTEHVRAALFCGRDAEAELCGALSDVIGHLPEA
jgi:hypothetical protein